MSKFLKASLFFLLTLELSAFAPGHTLEQKVKKADTILRVVILSAVEVDSDQFNSLAKCRIISKYKGGANLTNFVQIPIDWTVDPMPNIEIGDDQIVFLESLKTVAIAHPVFWDAALPINNGKIAFFKEGEPTAIELSEFEDQLRKLIKKWHRDSP